MKKQLFLIFLILVSWAQSGTIVTHYDLDGNLISEEFQQAIEEETLIEDNSMALQPDTEGNQLFEIEPIVSKSAEQETSSEYQQYQQQEKERQEQLQQITQQDNLDWSAGLDEVPTQQLSDKQEELSSLESDAQLQPTVASQDSVINIQQPVEEPLNVVNDNSAQIDVNDQAVPNNIPETPQVLDMPTQQQMQEEKVENQVEQVEKVDNQVEQVEKVNNQVEQVEKVVEQVEKVENQVEQVDQQSVPIVENFKALETENQETIPVEQIPKLQQDMISTEDQEMQSKMQEINPKEEDNVQPTMSEQEVIPKDNTLYEGQVEEQRESSAEKDIVPKEDEEEEKMQPSQIEEDIKFDANQQSGSDQQEDAQQQPQPSQEVVENQKSNELPLENQKTNDLPVENQKSNDTPIENTKTETPVQEIAQDFPLAKEQAPEKQVDLSNQDIKQANQIEQSKCIIIYSECDYQGYALEACDSLQQIEQFKHKIQSIYIPQGYGLTIYENENFNGHSHRYTSSQQCLQQQAVSFIQFSTTLSRQNLRSRI